jgi:hypothetical protein
MWSPAYSIRNPDERENGALTALPASATTRLSSAGTPGARAALWTGFHGRHEHTILYFDGQTLEKLLPGDRILIRGVRPGASARGFSRRYSARGLTRAFWRIWALLSGTADWSSRRCARTRASYRGGTGHGLGAQRGLRYHDGRPRGALRHGLEKLRFGDVVLLENCDNTYGRGYLTGAVSVGLWSTPTAAPWAMVPE